jgi:hypothetical protein
MHLRPSHKTSLAIALAAAFAFTLAPSPAAAAKADSCSVDGLDGLVESTLEATSSRPTIRGEVSGARSVQVVLRKEGSSKTYYTSKIVKVKRDAWSLKIPKKLADGEYDVEVYCPKVRRGESIAEGELEVATKAAGKKVSSSKSSSKADAKSSTELSLTSIPLLMGGEAEGGESVPVAYLKVTNTGNVDVDIEGFWVKQNGTASTKSVIGFQTVDGKGQSRVTTDGDRGDAPFEDNVAFAKADGTIAAGQYQLYTIKAILADSLGSAVGKSLKIDVTGVDGVAKVSAKFPIKGTTWTLR